MKTIYKVNYDGIYSTVETREIENSRIAKELIERDSDYFESFGEAKRELRLYVKRQLQGWKDAMKNVNGLNKKNSPQYYS